MPALPEMHRAYCELLGEVGINHFNPTWTNT